MLRAFLLLFEISFVTFDMNKPTKEEVAEWYHSYIERVEDGTVSSILRQQELSFVPFIMSIPEEKGTYRYADGKWTVKEIISHLIDTERVFCYRGLAISRGEPNPIPGFDQDIYVTNSKADQMSFQDLAAEFMAVRKASIAFYKQIDEETSKLGGTVSGGPMSVRSTAYIIAGHLIHHKEILQERYL